VETISQQTWDACGCGSLAAKSKLLCARGLVNTAYRLHIRSVCDVQRRCSCSMRLAALCKCYAFYPLSFSWEYIHFFYYKSIGAFVEVHVMVTWRFFQWNQQYVP